MPQEILFGIYAEIRETRAELKAHRETSDERNRSIHKRLDRVEDHFRSEVRDIRSMVGGTKAPSATSYLKVASSVLAHWQIIVTILLVIAGVLMGKSPDTIKAWVGSIR